MDLKIVIIIDIENIINPIDILLVTCNFDNNIHENKIIDDIVKISISIYSFCCIFFNEDIIKEVQTKNSLTKL